MSSRLFTAFLVIACAGLCLLTLLLARENRRLKSTPPPATPETGFAPRPSALRPGEFLPPLTLIDRAGRAFDQPFAAPGRRTLFLGTGGGCPHCETTIPIWNQILGEVGSPAVQVVGIQVDAEAPDRLDTTAARFDLHAVKNPRRTWLYGIPMIPATIIAGPDGAIEHAWFGELSPAQQEELRTALIEASAK